MKQDDQKLLETRKKYMGLLSLGSVQVMSDDRPFTRAGQEGQEEGKEQCLSGIKPCLKASRDKSSHGATILSTLVST